MRLYFETNSPGKFSETDYWWANNGTGVAVMTAGPGSLTQSLADPSKWSDYYGHFGDDPAYAAAYQQAVSHVTAIGLSYGSN